MLRVYGWILARQLDGGKMVRVSDSEDCNKLWIQTPHQQGAGINRIF